MNDLRTAAQQAIALICSARLCEVNSMSSRREMLRLLIEATDLLRAALAEPQHKPIPLNEGRLWQYSDGSIGVGTAAEPAQHSPATLIDPRGSLGEPVV